MINPIVIFFVFVSGVFALVHLFAIKTSLYWYYWWFDIVMHFWGGALLVIGIYSFCTFSKIHLRPSLLLVLTVTLGVAVGWEVFERLAGLYDPATYVFDTSKDLLVGLSGGLLAHSVLRTYTIK